MASSRATRGCGQHPDDSRQIAVYLTATVTAFQTARSPDSKPFRSVIEVLPGGRLEIGSIQPTMLGGPGEPLSNRPGPVLLDDGPGTGSPQLDDPIRDAIHQENHAIPSIGELDPRAWTVTPGQLRCRKRQPHLTQFINIKTVGGSHDDRGGFVASRRLGFETSENGPNQRYRRNHENDRDQLPIHMAYKQDHPC